MFSTASARMAGAALMVVLAATLDACTDEPGPRLELTACVVQGIDARCGRLGVPEDRIRGEGRRIELRVVVVPASAPEPASDPIVYFAGGPGGAASEQLGDMVAVRGSSTRDLVFVDQRGTGDSNRLVCPGLGSELPADVASAVRSCLEGMDADPRFYTTSMAVDDVADILDALGYEQANLYGGSYGATAAQVFQRRHPTLVRTMTLLGGTLLDLPIFELLPRNSQAALDDVLDRCTAEVDCGRTFPALRQDWRALMAGLAVDPVTVPPSAMPQGAGFTLTTDVLAAAVHQLLLTADDAAQIPAVIHGIATADDRAAVVANYANQFPHLLDNNSEFLVIAYAIRCNEAWARFEPAATTRLGHGSYYLANAVTDAEYWRHACQLFRSDSGAAEAGEAAASNTPVLAINGSADPQDPPGNMSGATKLWPNSRLLVAPHQSHSISEWRCQESIIDSFIEQGSVRGLDTGCLATVPPPAFGGTG